MDIENEVRALMHKLNSGVGKADHINLRDGIKEDSEGRILSVREDTKIPLGQLGAVDEYEVPADLNDVPDVDDDALAEWRSHKAR